MVPKVFEPLKFCCTCILKPVKTSSAATEIGVKGILNKNMRYLHLQFKTTIGSTCIHVFASVGISSECLASFKDYLPHLFHGFRNKYFNKISLDNMLYFHS